MLHNQVFRVQKFQAILYFYCRPIKFFTTEEENRENLFFVRYKNKKTTIWVLILKLCNKCFNRNRIEKSLQLKP